MAGRADSIAYNATNNFVTEARIAYAVGYRAAHLQLFLEKQMNLVTRYNQRAMEIWENSSIPQPRMPLLLPALKEKPELLVVGMNPSFNTEWLADQLAEKAGLPDGPWTTESLFRWAADARNRMGHVIEFEKYARTAYASYFSRIQNFAAAVGCESSWEHVDIFLMRETSQKEALKMVLAKTRPVGELNEFGQQQAQLFTQTLVSLQPKVVLVANATAGDIVKRLLGPSFPVGEPASLSFSLLPDTRFFFSGMLSGQRCMDNFSMERLVAQVGAYVLRMRNTCMPS